LVFHSSTIAMMHGPINIRSNRLYLAPKLIYCSCDSEDVPVPYHLRT